MSQVVQAIFENGIFRPLNKLELSEQELVQLTIQKISQPQIQRPQQKQQGDPSADLIESDVRLDPWVEFPLPSGVFTALAKMGSLPTDVPVIPAEEGAP